MTDPPTTRDLPVKNFLTERRYSAEKMQKINLFETPRFFCDVYCLEPGQGQKPHTHDDNDKIYAVLEGTVEVRVGEETRTLSAGETVLCVAGAVHGVENTSDARAALLVYMSPHPRLGA